MRVMIATVTAGAGHVQAAAALREAWGESRPEDTVEQVDVLDFSSPAHKQFYAKGYEELVKRAPQLYGMVFKETDDAELMRKLSRLRRSLARSTHERFIKHLTQFGPDVVLCTHFMPLGILGGVMAKVPAFHPFTVCVVTDFDTHAVWMEPCVDLYCVAAQETRTALSARGVNPDKLVVTGIPISASFSKDTDPGGVRRQYGLRVELPVLLVLSGGFGMGPIGKVLAELDRLDRPVQVLAVAGRNEKLRESLASRKPVQPTRVLGFVTNMNELMSVADLIVTKPGGLTSSEALAMGKPMVIINPIPGQECANSDFLVRHGAAVRVGRIGDLGKEIGLLLGSERLEGMAQAAKVIGRRRAAMDICRVVADRVKSASSDPRANSADGRAQELELPPAPKPAGVYKPLVILGDVAYASGHGPVKGDGTLIIGRVGQDLDLSAGKAAARQTGLALLATLREALGSLDRVDRVVKVLGMVNCTQDFGDHPEVINGCSELFVEIWGPEKGIGARSAVGVGSLPRNIAVEIEAVFALKPAGRDCSRVSQSSTP